MMTNISQVYNKGLCHGCGVCYAVCPMKTISFDYDDIGEIRPLISKKCIDCGACLRICSGISFKLFKKKSKYFSNFFGSYNNVYIGNSNNKKIFSKSSSGGVLTTVLIHLFKAKKIKGVIVTGDYNFQTNFPKIFIAKNEREIRSSLQSKYFPSPTGMSLRELLNSEGSFAFVGLPCQIQSLYKYYSLNPKLKKKFLYVIGLFCGHNISMNGTKFILKKFGFDSTKINLIKYRSGKWPGYFKVNGKILFDENNFFKIFGSYFFTPNRCLFCNDHTAELADISFGDNWLQEYRNTKGLHSMIITRNKKLDVLLQELFAKKQISLKKINPEKVIEAQQTALKFKKKNLMKRIKLAKLLRKSVPDIEILEEDSLLGYLPAAIALFNSYISTKKIFQKYAKILPLWIFDLYKKFLIFLIRKS